MSTTKREPCCDDPRCSLYLEDDEATVALHYARLEFSIERFGWAVQAVLDGPLQPGWSYTVGLARRGLPELAVVGLDYPVALQLLNLAGDRCVHHARPIRPGERIEELADVPLVALRVQRRLLCSERFASALVVERKSFLRAGALQLVWPDRRGRFAWEPGFDGEQDLLGSPPGWLN